MAESSLTVSSDMAQKENFVIEQRSYKKTFYAEHKTVIKQVNNKTEHVQTSEPRANDYSKALNNSNALNKPDGSAISKN